MLDEKAKGRDIVIGAAPAPKRGQVIDIMEALKRSMERVPAKKKLAAAPLTRRKRDRVQLLVASTRRRSVESNRLKTFRSPNLHFCQ